MHRIGILLLTIGIVFVVAQTKKECDPPCRKGFYCNKNGECVSYCNPPCPTGFKCTDSADCVPITEAQPKSDTAKAIEKKIECVKTFIVRPDFDEKIILGEFKEDEKLNACNMISNAINSKVNESATTISTNEMDLVKACNSRLIVAKIISYHKEPAVLGQFHGVITVSISVYRSPNEKKPVHKEEFTATGGRHWHDSIPLQNALEAVCKKISSELIIK